MTADLKLIVIDRQKQRHEVPALTGWRVMEIIRDNGLSIKAECGGSAACATCHVYVDPKFVDQIPPAQDDEVDQLDTVTGFDAERSRLSCQILMRDELNGLVVELAPGSEV